jgi:hypothetical protein
MLSVRTSAALSLALAAALTGTGVAAAPVRQAPAIQTGGDTGTVVGIAWRTESSRLPNAHLRLRNVVDGRSIATAESDTEGVFRFYQVPTGQYAVELVSGSGRVLALSELFTVAAGETVSTSVRLGSKSVWVLFNNAAAAVIAAASSLGVTAVGSNGRPASPQ